MFRKQRKKAFWKQGVTSSVAKESDDVSTEKKISSVRYFGGCRNHNKKPLIGTSE